MHPPPANPAPDDEDDRIFDHCSHEGVAFIAFASKTCGLTRNASFEPLDPYEHRCSLISAESEMLFSSHSAFRVPNDTSCASQRKLGVGTLSTVHRLVLKPCVTERLNERLLQLALEMAQENDGCVSKSNIGGYQSAADLFVIGDDEPKSASRLEVCRELHGIVSCAIDELENVSLPTRATEPLPSRDNTGGERSQELAIRQAAERLRAEVTGAGGGDVSLDRHPMGRDACGDDDDTGATTTPPDGLMLEARPFAWPWRRVARPPLACPLLPHRACAWLNVNKAADSNLMHVHHPDRFSAVYFVSHGGALLEGRRRPEGHLCFRGGARSSARRCRGSHTYFAVPPEPGTLWVFPGSMPHCVLPFGARSGDGGSQSAGPCGGKIQDGASSADDGLASRVSVAINLERACPRPAHECELSLAERVHIADRTMPYR